MPPGQLFDGRRVATVAAAISALAGLSAFVVLSNGMHRRRYAHKREKSCVEQRHAIAFDLVRSAQRAIASGSEASRKQTTLVTAAVHYQHALSALSAAQSIDPDNHAGIDVNSMYQDCRTRRDDVMRRIARLSGGKFQTKAPPNRQPRAGDGNDVRVPAAPGRL